MISISSLSEAQSSLINKMAARPETMENSFAATNPIQVRIDENVRLLAELHAKWEREDEIARNSSICTITTTNVDASKPHDVPIPFATMPIGIILVVTTIIGLILLIMAILIMVDLE